MESATATPGWEVYACPGTDQQPTREGNSLVSPADGRRFPVRRGIPNFNRHPPAEDAATAARLERLNDLAREKGWLEAVRTVYQPSPDLVRYVTDAGRARYLDLLPLTRTRRVLEIGPGLGQFTPLLARQAAWVHALEVVEQQAQFVAERCRQSQAANVSVACGGDDCTLPYRDQSFDVVVLNLVLEWCGSREPGDPAEALQRRLLGEIRRVLGPGGVVFLSTKNRYALKYLLGGRDEHMHHVRFGSALPRILAKLIMTLLRKPNPPGRLYSWGRLRGMLCDSGLEVMTSFWAAPEMRFPTRLIDTAAEAVRAARRAGGFPQGDSKRTAAIMRWIPAAMVKYFTPGLVFTARRPVR
jgi:SAM-dependent methyltransferase